MVLREFERLIYGFLESKYNDLNHLYLDLCGAVSRCDPAIQRFFMLRFIDNKTKAQIMSISNWSSNEYLLMHHLMQIEIVNNLCHKKGNKHAEK